MIRLVVPGGSYCEAFPGGLHFALVGKDVQTHAGTLINPLTHTNQHGETVPDIPRQPRWHPSGMLIGQGSESGLALHWNGWQWMKLGVTCGVNSCAFHPNGSIVINTNCHLGTQGIRWIDPDGTIHTGDLTYDGRGTTGVAEWTRFGDVTIGQSYVDGCTIYRDGDRPRNLEPGHCTFVRFNRNASQLAVALWKQTENCAVFFWLTVDEIAALPPEPVQPPPHDPPPHDPPPGPKMNYDTARLQAYADARWFTLPHATREQQAESLFRILYDYRQQSGDPIEVFRKGRVGTHFVGSDGEGYAEDICVINEGANGKWFRDVGVAFGIPSARLDFGPGWARPSPGDEARCFPPPRPADQPPEDPPPPANIDAKLAALEAKLRAEQAGSAGALKRQIDDLSAGVQILGEALTREAKNHADRITVLENRPSGGSFNPDEYKVDVPVTFARVLSGTIKRK